ncbi:MAG: HupE/UreJ family protein [Cyanobacteriota bacterium]|nr:HupE/UreJ family protein [Cyanobacteriota bacterium]
MPADIEISLEKICEVRMKDSIKDYSQSSRKHFSFRHPFVATWVAVLFASLISLAIATPALAHHPFGGQTPNNFFEGFLSGMGHPVVGLDHLAFVVAIGLIAAGIKRGILIPISFAIAAMLGTGIHLASMDLPLPEIAIAFSVLAFGVMLALKQKLDAPTLAVIAAVAGIFHGYAYGETIVGAEMAPLIAYLAGFTAIQMAIALGAMYLAKFATGKFEGRSDESLVQSFGWAIGGIGIAFLTDAILG